MRKIILYFIFLFMHCAILMAQSAPDTLWSKTFGGSGNDIAHSVQQTSEDGFIISGYTNSYGSGGGNDIWIIKTDTNGNELWTNTFGSYQSDEKSYSIQQTTDNGFIIVGSKDSNILLLKTDENGTETWSRWFTNFSGSEGWYVQQTFDNGYIIVGKYNVTSTNYDVCLIKTYSNGNEEWSQTFGGTSYDIGYSVQQTSDDGFIIAGKTTNSFGDGDVYLIRTDGGGNLIWQNTFDFAGSFDSGKSVQQTSDGGFIIAGSASNVSGYQFVYLINDLQSNWRFETVNRSKRLFYGITLM